MNAGTVGSHIVNPLLRQLKPGMLIRIPGFRFREQPDWTNIVFKISEMAPRPKSWLARLFTRIFPWRYKALLEGLAEYQGKCHEVAIHNAGFIKTIFGRVRFVNHETGQRHRVHILG